MQLTLQFDPAAELGAVRQMLDRLQSDPVAVPLAVVETVIDCPIIHEEPVTTTAPEKPKRNAREKKAEAPEPVAEVAVETPAAAPQAATAAKPAPDLATFRDSLKDYIERNGFEAGQELLKDFGVARVSGVMELPAEEQENFLRCARG